jgi:hypothetical protein
MYKSPAQYERTTTPMPTLLQKPAAQPSELLN